jgi:intein/homing endonuclease
MSLDLVQGQTLEEIDVLMQKAILEKSTRLNDMLHSNDPNQIYKAQQYLSEGAKKGMDLKSYLFAPEAEVYSGLGFKDTLKTVSYEVLRGMAKVPIIQSIILTRKEQVHNFAFFTTDLKKQGWTIVKKPELFEEKEKELTSEDKRQIEYIVNFLKHGGENSKWAWTDDFEDFLSKMTDESLTIDQACFEIERKRNGKLASYSAVDGAMIRLLETIDPFYEQKQGQEKYQKQKGFYPYYCQVWNNQVLNAPGTSDQIVYYPWEMCFGVRNKSTSVFNNGYGTSELEILIQIITYILYGFQYNGNFFKQGSNPRGFFWIKGNVGQKAVDDFKMAWRQMVAGVGNSHKVPVFEGEEVKWQDMQHCLDPETKVFVGGNVGIRTLGELLGDEVSVFSELWNGISFEKCNIVKTGDKRLVKTTIDNKIDINTSPDHRFLVLRESLPEWVEQKELKLGDYVLLNKKSITEKTAVPLIYKGKIVDADLLELLGWITGDGHVGDNLPNKRMMKCFYHPTKEEDIKQRHLLICEKYGINGKIFTQKIKKEYIQKFKERYKISHIFEEYEYMAIVDSQFIQWLFDVVGISTSRDGKVVPGFLYTSLSSYKCGFLKGLFSADGSISKNGSRIDLTCSNPVLKQEVILLLLSEGIRCTSFKLKPTQGTFGVSEDCVLLIKDRDVFVEKIGFLQEYKVNRYINRVKSSYKENELSVGFRQRLALSVKKFNKALPIALRLDKWPLHDLLNISRGHQKSSLTKVIHYAKMIGYPYPSFIDDYNFGIVTDLVDLGYEIPMVDVEMFDDNHQFCANGIIVHNSNKDMEFQEWNDFLTLLACAVFRMDSEELGFHFRKQGQMFSQQGQKERLQHSENKGLKPLLAFHQKIISKYLVEEINDKFEFKFTGIDIEDQSLILDNDIKLGGAGYVSLEDMFLKYSGRRYDKNKDTVLNPVVLQLKQMEQFGGPESNAAVDEMNEGDDGGRPNPFDQYEKGNPFLEPLADYIEKHLK